MRDGGLRVLFFITLFGICAASLGCRWTSASDGDFNQMENWSCGRVPKKGDEAIIDSDLQVTLNQGSMITLDSVLVSNR